MGKDGKDIDPIGTLKDIFKPDQVRKKRIPLDLNPISSKYRMQAREQARAMRTQREAAMVESLNELSNSQTKLPGGAKVFKEDLYLRTNQEGLQKVATPIDSDAGLLNHPIPPSSMKNIDVRGRLENLRKLFAEEDMNEAV